MLIRTLGASFDFRYVVAGLVFAAVGWLLRNKYWYSKELHGHQIIIIAVCASVIIAIVAIFFSYLSGNQFSDDEQEAAQFALSLATHPLPYWDLENGGTWTFYHSFMLFAYPMYVLAAVFGNGEFSFRVFYFICLFMVMVELVALFEWLTQNPIRIAQLAAILLGMFLIAMISMFYNSWDGYMAGLAEPSAVDMFGFSLLPWLGIVIVFRPFLAVFVFRRSAFRCFAQRFCLHSDTARSACFICACRSITCRNPVCGLPGDSGPILSGVLIRVPNP